MSYVKVSNQTVTSYPYLVEDLLRDNPRTSFPKRPSDSLLAQWGVYPVQATDAPAYDKTKKVSEGTPSLSNGNWVQTWNEVDATSSEIADRTQSLSNSVRHERDKLLAGTDWTANSDVTMSADMTTYRQALRDVPSQAGFPSTITWPQEPTT